jgi:hypothetical protein
LTVGDGRRPTLSGLSLRRLLAASSRLMFVMVLSLPFLGWGRTKEEG